MKPEKNLQPYCTDASMIPGSCSQVFFPTSSEEVARIVKQNTNISVRGGGTGLVGGCVPQGSVVIDLSKMNKILSIDIGKGIVEVESGIILNELNEEIEKHEFEFPVKPSSYMVCTIGGMIATNAVGNRAVKYGRTSDWVLELEVVNGKGEILKIKKNDMSDFTGMEGITGIITKARLKLALKKRRTASLLALKDINEVIENTVKLKLRNDVCAIEFLDKLTSGLLGLEENYHLIVEFESEDGKLKKDEYEMLIEKRDEVYPVLAKLGYIRIEDPKIMLNKFSELAGFLEENKIPFFGHLGSGILHPVFREGEEDKIEKMFDYVKKLHGQVSGEHGIGLRKKQFLDVNDKKLIMLVKKRQDPLCKINCNKVVDCYIEKNNEIAKEIPQEVKSEEQVWQASEKITEEISEEIKSEQIADEKAEEEKEIKQGEVQDDR